MTNGDWTQRPTPRICMPTWRRFTKRVYQCGLYEAQDVLCDTDDVDLLCVEPARRFRLSDPLHRRLLYHDVSRQLIHVNPGLKPVRLTQEYDLLVVLCQHPEELRYLSALDGWEQRCKTKIILIEEIWAASIPTYRPFLHLLTRFDHVFLIAEGSTAALAAATGRPCHWVPGAVDATRFTPGPQPPERVIDVYSIGRRVERLHERLLRMATQSDLFYLHDTVRTAATEAFDHREHRDLFAGVAKRSRCFLVAPAKMNAHTETNGQVEIGHRFYEAAAAGCVMLGQAPDSDSFRRLFDWEDAVIDVRDDGSDVGDVLRSLRADPCRVAAISRRNAAQALRHHDWVCRWKEIFRVAGLAPSARMAERERDLADRADAMERRPS